ncbi:hypothetical protein KIH74_28885 [Kineosporia sp. J2-2]|uniref:Transcriptional regulator, AbiEi antitoxin, Type IV TA system n=1 Tax=Kineosporia corallincola TaxID=2835133 RepID=A0ABS5TQT9_9ACTN|nr:hypothetical protein [Kineosporia corallincola]MBT0772994.1 hypothetical protein [Kineosporia corallincola]
MALAVAYAAILILSAEMDRWPVIVTNACAAEFGLRGSGVARHWLQNEIDRAGVVTDVLPAEMKGRRSPSGMFLLIEGLLVLPLAFDHQKRRQWMATNCIAFPEVSQRRRQQIDPLSLTGFDLMQHVNLTVHAVERFRERCGAAPGPGFAAQQMYQVLGVQARAVTRPPAWCRTRRADFYIVCGDDLCVPMSVRGSNGKAFDALTCIYRGGDLLSVTGKDLRDRCMLDPLAFRENDQRLNDVERAFEQGAVLSFWPPRWAPYEKQRRPWIHFSDTLASPARWSQSVNHQKPITVVGLVEKRSKLQRLFHRLRKAIIRWQA